MTRNLKRQKELPELINKIVRTYSDVELHLQHLGKIPLPSENSIVAILNKLRTVLFPGYFGRESVTNRSVNYYVGELLYEIYEQLSDELYKAFHQTCEHEAKGDCDDCLEKAEDICLKFIQAIPELRNLLEIDIQAAMDGDPAAKSFGEIIFSYPCATAITTYRIAHGLHLLEVPLIPRIMTEYAHRRTGIDIHPGARIGRRFFIDHGTGVVIGETTEIGENVKLYQGVTVGALSFPKNGAERARSKKRHPTIEDNVVVYSGATILGGNTVIGRDSIIGGNVWIISSVPPGSKVMIEIPKLRITANE